MIGDGIVSWKSNKQSCVALSSTETEYMALRRASKEAVWMVDFLHSLGLHSGPCQSFSSRRSSSSSTSPRRICRKSLLRIQRERLSNGIGSFQCRTLPYGSQCGGVSKISMDFTPHRVSVPIYRCVFVNMVYAHCISYRSNDLDRFLASRRFRSNPYKTPRTGTQRVLFAIAH